MPQEQQFQFVKLPNGEYGKFRSDASDAQIREAILKDFPSAYEGTVSAHARIFNEAATGSGDLSELLSKLKEKAKHLFEETPDVQIENWLKNLSKSESAAISKYGTGDYKRYVASIPMFGPALAQAEEEGGTKGLARLAGTAAGAGILGRLPGLAKERLAGIESDLQSLRSVAGLPGKTVRTTIRSVSDRGPAAVETAQAKATAEAAEKKEAYEQQVSLARTKARAEYEAGEAKKTADYEADRAAAKAKHEAKMEATKRGYGESVSQSERAKIRESRLESAKRSLSDLKDRYAEQTAENLDRAEAAEKKSLDTRYEDFRRQFLGVTPETPNGTVQAELTPVGEAIINARKNVLKGSKTNVPIFNDILGRLGDMVETPEGELKPIAGQMIPTDQLRGYISELNERIYEADLPYDVRGALKGVLKEAENQVSKSIEDVGGRTATSIYKKLKADYSDYMDTWRDRSSGSPLPKIRSILRSSIATKRGIPIYREIGKLIEGRTGEKSIAVIARKKSFGADPVLAAKLRAAAAKLDSLPASYGKIPVVKRPEFPKYAEPAPPEETTSAKYELPKPPEIKPFDPQQFIREGVQKRMSQAGNLGMGWSLLSGVSDLLHGNVGASLSMAERLAVMQTMKSLLTSKRFLDWVSKEAMTGLGGAP